MIKKPKPRIKRVFNKVMENNGFNVGKAMLEEGYAISSTKNPKQVTESKSWELLLNDIEDSKLINVLNEGLEATQVKTSMTEPDRTLPDFAVRHRYLETGLKMKGRLVEKRETNLTGNNVIVLPEQQLNKKRDEFNVSSGGGKINND